MVASIVPDVVRFNGDIHLVLCGFGQYGQAFVEADTAKASRYDIVRNLLAGRYRRPLRVIALNLENWSRDVSEDIALEIARTTEHEGRNLTEGTREFLIAHLGSIAVEDGFIRRDARKTDRIHPS
jgi:hypothetical protein